MNSETLPASTAGLHGSNPLGRRSLLKGAAAALAASAAAAAPASFRAAAAQDATPAPAAGVPATAPDGKPWNFLIIWGDDVGWWNPSCYNNGMMGFQTPNMDRIAAA